ncbi:MAG: undecaprenyl-diphosphate phosphatase [Limnochordia bacterium]|nr:undecaprenyl-diphosphate phosphatase [Bacillota bacterium]HOB08116.1 undecaprenyl-diphosphate phosphatase [Limnochordia bacterium]NLH30432.1 undecaprenyl-diphosphate phosphatase [Bacillota bacterium]HPT92411.1 undecaprenyl-diphosphate phosphatase [Limnochordia bacterium]HPZ30189.1 undecaprenyl-diphosphate phosphatase [Limnochordia bacterium]
MDLVQAVILGIVQGMTEFLPISSSGHLVLFGALLKVDEPGMLLEIMLHFGTLIAVFAAFWRETALLAKAVFIMLGNPTKIGKLVKENPGCRLVVIILLATVPAAVFGLAANDWLARLFDNPRFTGAMLCVTGTILFLSNRARPGGKTLEEIGSGDGLAIGFAQALAVLPGISRSGTTIAAGLFRGINRESAAKFSFLLSIPAVLGSQLLAVKELVDNPAVGVPLPAAVVGTVTAAVSGYFAIRLLLNFVRRGRLTVFSYYTWIVGLIVLLLA